MNSTVSSTGEGLDEVLNKMGEKLLDMFKVPWIEGEGQTFDETIKIHANARKDNSSCSC